MKSKLSMLIICSALCFSVKTYEHDSFAAAVETVGELKASGGIRFNDNSLQTSACSGCAELVPIDRGGTGADNALDARTNLDVPGLQTPNTFTADQTFQGDISVSGNIIIPDSTATTGIIMSGASRLMHTYGDSSFFAGTNAGNLSMTGNYNTGIGYFALFQNTNGNRNTATGLFALSSNTSGSYNTATGSNALDANTTGERNTAIGFQSLHSNTKGGYNMAGGYAALRNNTTAHANTALGVEALYTQSYSNTDTTWNSHNTAVGYHALHSNQPTSVNNGVYNTAIGSLALWQNGTGNRNTASGYKALFLNSSGNYNTATGFYALSENTVGSVNTAMGYDALRNNLDSYNTALGYGAGNTNTTGNHNTFIGYNSDAAANNLTNATAIGNNAEVNASNKVRIGNTTVTVIEGQVGWSFPSDIRIKKDVENINQGLAFINALRPVKYRLKEGNDRIDFGFIAQEIEALLGTDYNVLGIGEDSARTLSLRYTDFIAPMVKAMQEQQEMIELLKAEVAELKRMLAKQ